MNEELATQNSEPTRGRREAFIRFAAKVSVAAPLIAIGFDLVTPKPDSRAGNIIIGSIGLLIIVAGLVLAILALRSVRRYGREGIRTPAIAGLIINGAFLVVAVVGTIALVPALRAVARTQNAGFTRAEMEAMPEVMPGSRKILNEAIGFRMEVPGDCKDNPERLPAAVLHSFIQPDAEKGNLVINVTKLGGRIVLPLGSKDVEALRKAFPPDAQMQRTAHSWGSLQLDVLTVQYQAEGISLCGHFVWVPLCRETIQVAVTGPAPRASESLSLLYRLLEGLKGKAVAPGA